VSRPGSQQIILYLQDFNKEDWMPIKEKLPHAFEMDDFDSVYKTALNQGGADLGRPTEK
jgi:hypothetical protein